MRTFPSAKSPVLAVTLGDPGGIGPEVTVKAIAEFRKHPSFGKIRLVLIGPARIYGEWFRRLKTGSPIEIIPSLDPKALRKGAVHVLDMTEAMSPVSLEREDGWPVKVFPDGFERGKLSKRNALLAYTSLRIAAHLAACGKVQGLVTAPINKEAMRLLDPEFIGHTEYLAKVSGTRRYAMMFDGGNLKVALATIHVPLASVSRILTRKAIGEKIKLCHDFLKRCYRMENPRIAVCALNPHGREFGNEEEEKIEPAIRTMKKKGIRVTGPHPGDTVFHGALRGKYDLVLAMYHDQGLAPLKTFEFTRAVNITAGLPFIRTSPDHGTAFDIAFRNRADSGSMLSAISLASRLMLAAV